MPSATYELFREAMGARRQVVCTYHGPRRELCPIILGHSGGSEKALAFQFGGDSTKPLPPAGAWRCLTLSEVTDASPCDDGKWHSGSTHSTSQSCVESVDYDVNPASPYDPRHRL